MVKWSAHQEVEPKRREWILSQISKGKLDGKTLLYYKPMEVYNNDGTVVKGGYHSHADTLAEIVEELRGKATTQPTVTSIKLIPENKYSITSYTNEPKKGTYHDILRTGKKPLEYKVIDVSDKGVIS